MGSEMETFRREVFRKGDPLYRLPMNQKMAKDIMRKQREGRSPNAEKAKKRKEREFLRRQTRQFQEALSHILEGHDDMDTPEAWDALSAISQHEEVIGTYLTRKGTIVTIALVDLLCPNGIDSKAVGQEETFA